MLLCCAALLPAAKSLALTAALYAVACCMAQTVPSFVNALGMAAERKGMRLNFGISRGAGSIGFGLTAQLANVLLLRGGLRPAAIIRSLDLRRPIYQQVAAYGHFGRADLDLPWEKTDAVERILARA